LFFSIVLPTPIHPNFIFHQPFIWILETIFNLRIHLNTFIPIHGIFTINQEYFILPTVCRLV
jgi:hypothetical protein